MEKYSKEAFNENEKIIRDAEEVLADHPGGIFGATRGVPRDPSEVMGARWNKIAGEQQRERLLDAAYDEALQENEAFDRNTNSQEEIPDYRVGSFSRIVIETESGNEYTIERQEDGKLYKVINKNQGTTQIIPAELIENSEIQKGRKLLYGNGGQTTVITGGQLWR